LEVTRPVSAAAGTLCGGEAKSFPEHIEAVIANKMNFSRIPDLGALFF
jgi:hypothetical protein